MLRAICDDSEMMSRSHCGPLHRIGRTAFAVHDRGQRQLIALLFDRDRFGHADVVRPDVVRGCWPMRPCIASFSRSLSLVKLTRGPGSGKVMNAI